MAIGWVGSDVADWIGERASDAGDAFTSVAAVVPFSRELGAALKDLINGPLRDFARSPYGLVVLRAMTTTIYGPLAWMIGPQVAALAFALPGIARGEDFWHAWLTELNWRAEKTAEALAPSVSAAITPKIQEAAQALSALLPEQVQSYALAELADRLHVDEWTVAMAEALLGMIPIPNRNDYDPITGGRRGGAALSAFALRASSAAYIAAKARDVCVKASEARADGLPAAIVASLERQCDAASAAIRGDIAPASRTAIASGSSSSQAPRNGSGSSVALVVLGIGAVAALVWWKKGLA